MSDLINYDKPIRDLIDELSATGHVTHKAYRKTSVTFHHNAGTGGHNQVLRTWQSRPASAHFNVDQRGTIAQFVKVNEYAWATGNTEGNARSISIEMTNSGGHPDWPVGELTWKAAARLAAWLHWKVLGVKPTHETVKYHSDWKATACPGPDMKGRRDVLLSEVQRQYAAFTKPKPSWPPANTSSDKVKQFQSLLEVAVDGKWGPNTDSRALMMRNASWTYRGYPERKMAHHIKTVQKVIDTDVDGIWGPKSEAAMAQWVMDFQRFAGVRVDGWWGRNTDGAFLNLRRRYKDNY